MYRLVIDYAILVDFELNKPLDPYDGGSFQENQAWNSFFAFLKCGANIEIINYDASLSFSNILGKLTSGRENSSISLNDNYKRPYKNTFKDQNLFTIYFLNETEETEMKQYVNKNPFIIAFKKNYKQTWELLSLINAQTSIPIRKEISYGLKKPEDLAQYFLKVSDVILIDNFIFDIELMEFNLLRLLELIQNSYSKSINVLIIAHEGKKYGYPLEKRVNKFKELLTSKKLQINFKIIFNQTSLKEHDRQLIINNFRIKSGDSFNYFNSKSDIITKGTEIDIYPLVHKEHMQNTLILLNKVQSIVNNTPNENVFGNANNLLLSF